VRERLKRTLPVAFADSVRAQIRASSASAAAGDLLDISFRKKEKLGEGAQRAIAAAPAASGASPSLQVWHGWCICAGDVCAYTFFRPLSSGEPNYIF
jgi:hypothetical protein